ncbi:MAG: peptidylprolyl isomerase [Phycisphaerae bacterium]
MTRIVGLAAAALLATAAFAQDSKPADPAKPADAAAPTAAGDNALMPKVALETSMGKIVIELNGEKAPISVMNFLNYVEAKHYDGLIFHRVMATFMIQGGGFMPDLTEKKDGLKPPIKNEWRNGLKNARGTIAMARTQMPDSATAQFFINVVDNARLDEGMSGGAGYAVFGRVVEGMDVVDAIKDTPVKNDPKLPMGKVVPETPVVISAAKIAGTYDKSKLEAQVNVAEAEQKKAAEAAAEQAKKSAQAAADEAKKSAATRAAEQEVAVKAKIAEIEKETGKKVEKSASGLMWVTMKDGAGESPKPTSTVKVEYTGWLVNGQEFDSSKKSGGPVEFPLTRVIQAWTEGVGMMKVGEKRKLIVPPDIGYGAAGHPGGIPPNSWLIFEIELISFK